MDALFEYMQDLPQHQPEEQKTRLWLFALGLVGQLGFMIAVPIALFALGGSLLDKTLETSPVFLLGGVLLASIITAVWIAQRTRTLRDRYMELFDPKPAQKRV